MCPGIFSILEAQEYNYILDRYQYNLIDKALNTPGQNVHSAFKPLRINDIRRVINPDTIVGVNDSSSRFSRTWIGRKLYREHLFKLDSSDYQIYLDPLFSFDIGKDFLFKKNTYTNSRGFQISGNFGKKFSFYTCFWENQARFVNYVDSFIQRQNVVPGQGRIKPFGNGGYDFAWVAGYLSYSPSKYFNFQLGNDKQFVGDGYRSLLLSDNSFNYPFAKITTSFWRIRYTNLFTAFQNVGSASNSGLGGYQKKYGSFHHLSWNIGKRLNMGLFEAVIWQSVDTAGQKRNFDVNYFNPIIFYRPLEFSLGSPDNVLLGIHFKYIFLKNNVLYGQLMLDEFAWKEVRAGNGWWGNKQGFQLGIKVFNLFKQPNLMFQSEVNCVRPYTYGHSVATQSYTHFAQPLAHPLGANFMESINFLRYRWKRFGLEGKIMMARYGADSLKNGKQTNVGQNIFVATSEAYNQPSSVPSVYGNQILQGRKNTLIYSDLSLSWLINRKTNMRIELTLSRRAQENLLVRKNTNWIFLSFRSALPNRYYDF